MWLRYAPAAAVFLYLLLLTLVPLSNPDLWWHLKAGERILAEGELQGDKDAFSYTEPEPIPVHVVRGMRSQWLGQVLLHLVHAAWGFGGLAIVRGVLLVLPFVWLYGLLLRQGHQSWQALALISFPALYAATMLSGSFERPQGFSFILALAVLLVLERIREEEPPRWMYAVLPLMMALWANLHGGFIIGNAMIVMYAAGETVRAFLRRGSGLPQDKSRSPRKEFLFVCGLSVLASFLNPNTYHLFLDWVQGMLKGFLSPPAQRPGYVMQQVTEYRSPWFFYRHFDQPWYLILMGFLGFGALASLVGFMRVGRPSLGGLATSLMVGFFSMTYVRIVPFAVYLYSLFTGMAAASFRRRVVRAVPAALMVLLSILFSVVLFMSGLGDRLVPSVPHSWVGGNYPEGAIQFMRQAGIEGPLFNPVHWGGYIIFRAHPEYRVFIDGRSLSNKVLRDTHTILNAGPGWERTLDSYQVMVIMIPVVAVRTGDAVPLVKALAWNRDWSLVYLRNDQAVFVRDREDNREIIRSHGLEKSAIWQEMLRVSESMLAHLPGSGALQLARVEAYHNLGRYAEARQAARALEEAARRRGGSADRETLQMLHAMGY
jgi:hypothetical protein